MSHVYVRGSSCHNCLFNNVPVGRHYLLFCRFASLFCYPVQFLRAPQSRSLNWRSSSLCSFVDLSHSLSLCSMSIFTALRFISTAAGTDKHYVAYLATAGYVIDNEAGAKVPVVDGSYRTSNKQAIKVFKQLFPRASSITLRAISSVSVPLIWSMPSKPTVEDMFLELYP